MSGIFIALGANLEHLRHGPPRATCEAALEHLQSHGPKVLGRSRWYRSAPVPPSGQPWFVNGVAEIATSLGPDGLLALLHRVEDDFGRIRLARDEARVLDLDLIAYGRQVSAPGAWPVLPHPRLSQRAFVVLPLAELAPAWRHPISGLRAADLAKCLPDQGVTPIEDD